MPDRNSNEDADKDAPALDGLSWCETCAEPDHQCACKESKSGFLASIVAPITAWLA